MIDDEKVNLGPFATLFGHGFGFFDDRKARSRGPGSAFGPARRFSAHFGCLGGCAPSVARIPVMARRTCRGVTGRVLLSHGRRTAATKPAGSSAQTARACAGGAGPRAGLASGNDSHARGSSAACRETRPPPREPEPDQSRETNSHGGRADCQPPQNASRGSPSPRWRGLASDASAPTPRPGRDALSRPGLPIPDRGGRASGAHRI